MAKSQMSSKQDAAQEKSIRGRDYAEFSRSAPDQFRWHGGFSGIGSRGPLGSSGLLPHTGAGRRWDGDDTLEP